MALPIKKTKCNKMEYQQLEPLLKCFKGCYVKLTISVTEEHPWQTVIGEIDYYGLNSNGVHPHVRIKQVPHLAELFPKCQNNETTLNFGYESIVEIQKYIP